jgi:hypothetical protein
VPDWRLGLGTCSIAGHGQQPFRSTQKANPLDRAHSELLRGKALRQAKELKLAGKLAEALEAPQWSAKLDRDAQELLRLEAILAAEKRRDYLAELGLVLSELGDKAAARKIAKEAERWVVELEKLRARAS